MKITIKFAAAAIALFCLNTANAAQCTRVLNGSMNTLAAQASNNFINCIVPEGVESAAKLTVTTVGIDGTVHATRVMGINQDGTTNFLSQSSTATATTVTVYPAGRTVGISVPPGSSLDFDKKLTVVYNYQAETATAVVTILIAETSVRSRTSTPPPSGPGTGTCNGRICTIEQRMPGGGDISLTTSYATVAATISANPLCNSSNTLPPQENKNKKFDTNKALAIATNIRLITEAMPLQVREATRAGLMAGLFMPGRDYDLKNNPEYLTHEKFGNSFFGAFAAQMGYSKNTSIKAGALVQQYQNYTDQGHPNKGNVEALLNGIYRAAVYNEGDMPGDSLAIGTGYDYATQVYQHDSAKSTVTDSCTREPTSTSAIGTMTGGGSTGGMSSWGSSGAYTAGGNSCTGRCGSSGTVEVGDIRVVSSSS